MVRFRQDALNQNIRYQSIQAIKILYNKSSQIILFLSKEGSSGFMGSGFSSHQYPKPGEEANSHQCTHEYWIIHKLRMGDQQL